MLKAFLVRVAVVSAVVIAVFAVTTETTAGTSPTTACPPAYASSDAETPPIGS